MNLLRNGESGRGQRDNLHILFNDRVFKLLSETNLDTIHYLGCTPLVNFSTLPSYLVVALVVL